MLHCSRQDWELGDLGFVFLPVFSLMSLCHIHLGLLPVLSRLGQPTLYRMLWHPCLLCSFLHLSFSSHLNVAWLIFHSLRTCSMLQTLKTQPLPMQNRVNEPPSWVITCSKNWFGKNQNLDLEKLVYIGHPYRCTPWSDRLIIGKEARTGDVNFGIM